MKPFPTDQKAKRVGSFGVVLLVLFCTCGCDFSSTPSATNYGREAYYAGRMACEDMLKAPRSAKFSTLGIDKGTGWELYGEDQWRVGGFVDAQNSFGAMLREQWEAVVKKEAAGYRVVYLRLGNQETGQRPSPSTTPETQPARVGPSPEEIAARVAALKVQEKAKADAAAERVLKHYLDLVAKGDAVAQYEMATRYLTGNGVPTNRAEARVLLIKAAKQGHTQAEELLLQTSWER